jgi:hypothetical protein
LKEAGLNHNDLRSLIRQGLVAHAMEKGRIGAKARSFRQTSGLRLHLESCFVLSGWGLIVTHDLSPTENILQPDGNERFTDSIQIVPI